MLPETKENMPALNQALIDSLTKRLTEFLQNLGNPNLPTFIAAGGSAAVFKVNTETGLRAYKVFDPRFFQGTSGDVERKRLEVQRRLISHDCPTLIQTYRTDEYDGTAFMEMEYLDWPALKDILPEIPDSQVGILLQQLVSAAQYLEQLGIVHRDIKPENIHVSKDFSMLKLLDLGVAREIEAADGIDAIITDHNNKRPFLATAQYSSPEYLFRLDEPSTKLWKGLTFYQIGAVLHDLIMKVQLFDQEVSMDNKWLVAKAVLLKSPSFVDGKPHRLASLKALAARCLVKDLDTRLRLVRWQDFEFADDNPRARLKLRLNLPVIDGGSDVEMIDQQRLKLEKDTHWSNLIEKVRNSLIEICTNQLTFVTMPSQNIDYCCKFQFILSPKFYMTVIIQSVWGSGYHNRKTDLFLKASIHENSGEDGLDANESKIVCSSDIEGGIDEPVTNLTDKIALLIEKGLDNNQTNNIAGQIVLE